MRPDFAGLGGAREKARGANMECRRSRYRAAPFSLTTLVTVLFVNHLLLTQLDSSMSVDVFLSFRRCPKRPNTLPFDFGTPIA